MKDSEIKNILNKAKIRFLNDQKPLLAIEANERSITHKFAEYLQAIFGNTIDVDCEYNRSGENTKIIEEIKQIVGKNTTTSEIKVRTVYPDIIIHKRGSDSQNLLVIEAKKDATKKEEKMDKNKLKKIKEEYGYSYAVFLNFRTGKRCDIEVDFI